MEKRKLLILGASGMLGTQLEKVFNKSDIYEVVATDMYNFDITNEKQIAEIFSNVMPDIVINAAAYTNVDDCEKEKTLCEEINGRAIGKLLKYVNEINTIFVHYSTDYVFDGKNDKGYKEDDVANPINQYGKSKEIGEKYIFDIGKKYYLIRTSWLFGKKGSDFVDKMLELSKKKKFLEVVNDQHGKPTYAKDLAKRTKELIEGKADFGVYHITNENTTTWYDFAKEIFRIAKINIKVKPVFSEEFARAAKRPKFSALINTKLPKSRPWQEALAEYIKNYEK